MEEGQVVVTTIACNICHVFGAELMARGGGQINQLRQRLKDEGWQLNYRYGREDICPKCQGRFAKLALRMLDGSSLIPLGIITKGRR